MVVRLSQVPSNGLVSRRAPRADVLLVATTDLEMREVRSVFRKRIKRDYQRDCQRIPFKNITYLNLGEIAGARTFLIQSDQGAGGPGGVTLTVNEAIQE